jgi:hypothetical protein
MQPGNGACLQALPSYSEQFALAAHCSNQTPNSPCSHTACWPHLKGDVASCSSRGPTARALGARKGDRKGMLSVAGRLLNDINTLPSRCSNGQKAQENIVSGQWLRQHACELHAASKSADQEYAVTHCARSPARCKGCLHLCKHMSSPPCVPDMRCKPSHLDCVSCTYQHVQQAAHAVAHTIHWQLRNLSLRQRQTHSTAENQTTEGDIVHSACVQDT